MEMSSLPLICSISRYSPKKGLTEATYLGNEAQMLAALKLEIGALLMCICHTTFDQAYEVCIVTTGGFLMLTLTK